MDEGGSSFITGRNVPSLRTNHYTLAHDAVSKVLIAGPDPRNRVYLLLDVNSSNIQVCVFKYISNASNPFFVFAQYIARHIGNVKGDMYVYK